MADGQQPSRSLSSEARAIPAPFQFLLDRLSEKQQWIRQQRCEELRGLTDQGEQRRVFETMQNELDMTGRLENSIHELHEKTGTLQSDAARLLKLLLEHCDGHAAMQEAELCRQLSEWWQNVASEQTWKADRRQLGKLFRLLIGAQAAMEDPLIQRQLWQLYLRLAMERLPVSKITLAGCKPPCLVRPQLLCPGLAMDGSPAFLR